MIYNLKNETQSKIAKTRLEYLIKKGKRIEIREIRKKRSVNQNGYLHLLLGWFGLEFGYDVQTVKDEFFKKRSPDIFLTNVAGSLGSYQRLKSTAELDTKEMTIAIDRFRDYSANEAGFYLPEPNEDDYLNEIKNKIEEYGNAKYL